MKRYSFGLISIVITIASFSFEEFKKGPLLACIVPKKWWLYQGPQCPGTATLSDILNASNYIEITPQQVESTCAGNEVLCAICAAENGTTNRPVIDATLQTQLVNYYFSVGTNVGLSIVEKP